MAPKKAAASKQQDDDAMAVADNAGDNDSGDEGGGGSASTARPQLVLNVKEEKGFVATFRALPPKANDKTLRLFERPDYYSAHGDDALFVAQHVYKTSTVIKYLGGDATTGVAGVCVSRMQTIALLTDLLVHRQYRVEIFSSSGSSGNWQVKLKGSPGNLQDFEEMLFHSTDMDSSPVVLAVKVGTTPSGAKVIGVASADATARRFLACELPLMDNLANFEALVVQMGVKECLLPDEAASSYEHKKMRDILDHCGAVVTEVKKGLFATKNIDQDLGRLLPEDKPVSSLPEYELKNSMASLSSLITYLDLLGDERNFGQFQLGTFDLDVYMRLDASAAKALNIMPDPYEPPSQAMSLFSLLNKCKTPQGTRLLQQFLKQPLLDMGEITKRHSIVEAFVQSTQLRQTLREDDLKRIPDLNRLSKRFQRGNANLQDVVRTYQAALRLPTIVNAFNTHAGENELLLATFAQPLQKLSKKLDKYVEMVESTVDLEAVTNHEFIIKPDYDSRLKDTREQMNKILDELPAILNKVARDLGLDANKKIKLEHNALYGHYLRVNRADSTVLRGQKQYEELATLKSGVFFTTAKLKSLSDQHANLSSDYNKLQTELVKEVIKICATYCPVLEGVNELVANLDVLLSFAVVSVHAPTPFVRPTLHAMGTGDLVLKSARHACLEVQPDVTFIANDVEMRRGQSEFQIITGANMGGKSTYIRQIGMIILLAQVGCFVPCETAEIPLCDAILARIGAGDSQLKGVSTFMAEMLETASILKNATKNSFIIIDELGRGTSTYDGFGLAWAISDDIATRIKSFCLFATHFHELTALSDKVPSVKNMHVTTHISESGITLLYKVEQGICDQSFGIHVAQLAQFPQPVINLAKRKAAELEDFSSSSSGGAATSNKRSKEELEQADQLMQAFLSDVKVIPMASMSEEEILQAVKGLKDKMMAGANDALREILMEL